ncbi:hypothetical protein B566_EDAN003577 [Ephemera danica]|nr:hypothetical protein B566_EDAN003577 [Ephemera danica]
MSSPEDDDAPKSGVRHHLLLRPAEFPVTRVTDSVDSDETEDSDVEDGIELPESTRQTWTLSKAWLQDVLAEHLCHNEDERQAFTILQFSVRAGSEPASCHRHPAHEPPHESGLVIGDSALSEVISVSVDYRTNKEATLELVIKLPPRDPVSRFFVTEAQFDLREIKFYTQVNHQATTKPSCDETEDSDVEDGIELPESTRQTWTLSKAWLQDVLAEHLCHNEDERQAFTILQFSVRAGSEPASCHRHPAHEPPHESGLVIGDSALSEVISVSVDYRTNKEATLELVIKLPPRDPVSRFFVTEAQFDLREIKFYTQVVPELLAVLLGSGGVSDLPIPRCLHATYRAAPHHSVLILENLKSRGYRGANFAAGLTLAQARAAIRALARIHALSLVLKVRDGADLPQKYPFLFRTTAATDSYQQLVERGLPQLARFLQRRGALGNESDPPDTPSDALTSLRTRTRSVIASLLAPREPLSLITHTDFWCSNLLFREPDESDDQGTAEPTCAILDWQMITYSHPANDLALLIISSLDSNLRREHTPALLDFYLACLAQQCAPLGVHLAQLGYTGTMLREDFRRSQLLALLLCIGSVDVALGDTRTEERLLHVLKDLYDDGVLTDTTLTALE